jgi:hypothetical protein
LEWSLDLSINPQLPHYLRINTILEEKFAGRFSAYQSIPTNLLSHAFYANKQFIGIVQLPTIGTAETQTKYISPMSYEFNRTINLIEINCKANISMLVSVWIFVLFLLFSLKCCQEPIRLWSPDFQQGAKTFLWRREESFSKWC